MTVGTLARHISTTSTNEKTLTDDGQPRGKWDLFRWSRWGRKNA